MIPHTRTILTPPSSHKHHTMLLYIVALTGDIRRHRPARTQLDPRGLSLCRIRLFGFRDADFDADALQSWSQDIAEGRGDGVTGALRFSAALRYSS